MSKVGVILPAGGSGQRIERQIGGTPKQFRKIHGKPLYRYSLDFFSGVKEVEQIVLVLPAEPSLEIRKELQGLSKVSVVQGGRHRWQSVENGFKALGTSVECVLIHDVARPFLEKSVVDSGVDKVLKGQCALAAIPASDTLKKISGEEVVETLDRKEIIQVQTPQFFPKKVLEHVYKEMEKGEIPEKFLTDEAGMVEYLGYSLSWILGSEKLRKITSVDDLQWAEWMAAKLFSDEVPNG